MRRKPASGGSRGKKASRSDLEPVPNSRLVHDVPRLRGVVAELLANLGHHISRVVRLADRVLAPPLQQQCGVRHRLARVEREESQQLVLRRGQPPELSVDGDPAPADIDREVTGSDDRLAGGHVGLPAKNRANSRHQLFCAERLHHVVVGPGVERAHLVLLVRHDADDDHGAACRRPQSLQRRETIHARKPEVEKHHVRPPGRRLANRLPPAPPLRGPPPRGPAPPRTGRWGGPLSFALVKGLAGARPACTSSTCTSGRSSGSSTASLLAASSVRSPRVAPATRSAKLWASLSSSSPASRRDRARRAPTMRSSPGAWRSTSTSTSRWPRFKPACGAASAVSPVRSEAMGLLNSCDKEERIAGFNRSQDSSARARSDSDA